MAKKKKIFRLRKEVLRHLDEGPHVERLLRSQCGKTQKARIKADMTAIVAEWNSSGLLDQ